MNCSDPLKVAISEALLGQSEGGIPIGSVMTRETRVVARGHNRRVQQGNPVLHAEIDCLQVAGRLSSYRDVTLYSTLMPCYLCAGAVVQFGIPRVVVGENQNFAGAERFLREHGVEVHIRNDARCIRMMHDFILTHKALWNEDIGYSTARSLTATV